MTLSDPMERMKKDRFICERVGATLDEASEGFARASLEIEPDHLNGIGVVQGGVFYSLADYAFAAAANYAEPVIGIETTISFLRSATTGRITAEAREMSRTRSFSVCEVRVFDPSRNLLALFIGRGYVLKKRM